MVCRTRSIDDDNDLEAMQKLRSKRDYAVRRKKEMADTHFGEGYPDVQRVRRLLSAPY